MRISLEKLYFILIIGMLFSFSSCAITVDANLAPRTKETIDTFSNSIVTTANAIRYMGDSIGVDLKKTAQAITATCDAIVTLPHAIIHPLKINATIGIGFIGAIVSILLFKKGLEKSIIESEVENKSSFIEHIKKINKKGLILIITSFFLFTASFTTIIKGDSIIDYCLSKS